MTKLTIKQLSADDRPREKMMQKGADALSDAELLGILVGSGTADETAVQLMQRMLGDAGNDLNLLGKWELHDFCHYKGMGPAKSVTVMAALELGKRRKLQEVAERKQINTSADIYELMHESLRDCPQEELWLLLLNQSARLINRTRLSSGGITQTCVDVRSILREALLSRATQIVLVHNHPSGNTRPSIEDRRLTQQVQEAARIMNIRLTDHLIVTEGSYFSFCDEGLL